MVWNRFLISFRNVKALERSKSWERRAENARNPPGLEGLQLPALTGLAGCDSDAARVAPGLAQLPSCSQGRFSFSTSRAQEHQANSTGSWNGLCTTHPLHQERNWAKPRTSPQNSPSTGGEGPCPWWGLEWDDF